MNHLAFGTIFWLFSVLAIAQNSTVSALLSESGLQVALPPGVPGECIVRYSEHQGKRYEIRVALEDVQSLAKSESDLSQSNTGHYLSHPRLESAKMLQDIDGRPKHESGCWATSSANHEFRRIFTYLLMIGRSSVRDETNGRNVSSIIVKVREAPHRAGGIFFYSPGQLFFVGGY